MIAVLPSPVSSKPTGTSAFNACEIDNAPALLQHSYRLRYQVYCLERRFLRPEDYPQGTETDEFDPHSIHIGAMDRRGTLAGTARLVLPREP